MGFFVYVFGFFHFIFTCYKRKRGNYYSSFKLILLFLNPISRLPEFVFETNMGEDAMPYRVPEHLK